MYFSKYNIFGKIKNSDKYFLINPLTKNADILDEVKAQEIINENYSGIDEYKEKGYLIDEAEETALYKRSYLEFVDNRDEDELQIFFVPSYACNFNCSYCYQIEYEYEKTACTLETVDAFFKYINSKLAGRGKYITLFGGEPFLPSPKHKELVEYFFKKAGESKTDVAVVSNGYELASYIDTMRHTKIREIQITLDGMQEMHDRRRPLKNGDGSFDRIVKGIDLALEKGYSINLRFVVDKENINELPKLAAFAKEKGWTEAAGFKTQIGRNYELYCPQGEGSKLYERAELYEDVYSLCLEHPEILDFHRPAFSIAKFIFENGEMPEPLFDACPGTKTELAFDYSGRIYPCTATVGKTGEEIGSFYPEISYDEGKAEEWEERDVMEIEECRDCNLSLACGGGCAAVAKQKNGKVKSPDCRPIDKLLPLGLSLYFEKDIIKK